MLHHIANVLRNICSRKKYRLSKLTASGDVKNNSNVDVEVFWLYCEEDSPMQTEWVRVMCWVTVHLGDGVKAMFSLDGHLSVALVTTGRSSQEIIHTQRALNTDTQTHRLIDRHITYILAYNSKKKIGQIFSPNVRGRLTWRS